MPKTAQRSEEEVTNLDAGSTTTRIPMMATKTKSSKSRKQTISQNGVDPESGWERHHVRLDKIRTDGDTQARVSLNEEVVADYAEVMATRGVDALGDVSVFDDGTHLWPGDGFHRIAAAKRQIPVPETISCRIRSGSREDAQWYGFHANQRHGLRRTTDDKARAIRGALRHPNGAGCSDRQIADWVGVTDKTVGKYRRELESTAEFPQLACRQGIDGKVRKAKPATQRKTSSQASAENLTEEERHGLTEEEHGGSRAAHAVDVDAVGAGDVGAGGVAVDAGDSVDADAGDSVDADAGDSVDADAGDSVDADADDADHSSDFADQVVAAPSAPARERLYQRIAEYIAAAVDVLGSQPVANWLEMQVERLRCENHPPQYHREEAGRGAP
ncbi:MAG: hypothetical protein GXY83_40155 [Rhodopirellula sp.]|nr:hypothetical protein [Rhodopirellula sp.]